MHRHARRQGLKHHLVDDEVVELPFQGHRFAYRLRVWRSRGGPAIVLASQLHGGAPPCWMRTKLANLAYRAYLGFSEGGMLYFEAEAEATPGGPRLVQVEFEAVGHGLRRQLTRPAERQRRWEDLRSIVGAEVTA